MPRYKITDPDTGEFKFVMGDTPPTQEDVADIFGVGKVETSIQKPDVPQVPEKSVTDFLFKKVPENAYEFGKGAVTAISHPFQTAENVGTAVGNIAKGGLEKVFKAGGVPGFETPSPEGQAAFEAVSKPIVESVKNPLGVPGRLLDYAYEKPVDTAMMASGALGVGSKIAKAGQLGKTADVLGKASKYTDPLTIPIKVVGATAKVAKRLGKEIEGVSTGGGPGFIEEAAKGSKVFDKAMRGKISGEEVVQHAHEAVRKMSEDMGDAYRDKLARVRVNPNELTTVRAGLDQELATLMGRDEFQVGTYVDQTGNTRFTFKESPLVKNTPVIRRALEDVTNWTDNSALGLDNLKKRLSKYIKQVERRSPQEAFLTRLEKSLDKGLKNTVPEYEEMTRGYRDSIRLLRDIESNLMLRPEGISGHIAPDQTLRRLTSSLREPFEMRKHLVRSLGEKGAQEISSEVAGYVANQLIPRGAMGKLSASGSAYLLHGLNPYYWPLILASSPRVVGEFLSAYGKAKRTLEPIAPAIKKGVQFVRQPEVLAPLGILGEVKPSVGSFEGSNRKKVDPAYFEE